MLVPQGSTVVSPRTTQIFKVSVRHCSCPAIAEISCELHCDNGRPEDLPTTDPRQRDSSRRPDQRLHPPHPSPHLYDPHTLRTATPAARPPAADCDRTTNEGAATRPAPHTHLSPARNSLRAASAPATQHCSCLRDSTSTRTGYGIFYYLLILMSARCAVAAAGR